MYFYILPQYVILYHSTIFKTIDNSLTANTDIIKMKTDIVLTDKNGNIIEIKVPRPEYRPEIFSCKNGDD